MGEEALESRCFRGALGVLREFFLTVKRGRVFPSQPWLA